MQVKAARIHTSVELTPDALREGTETILVDEIVTIYPEAKGPETPKWQSARALGELTGVPRGRTGIGLKLTNDRTAQAWARRHKATAGRLDPVGGRAHPPRARAMRARRRATVELLVACVAAAGAGWCWLRPARRWRWRRCGR